MQLDPTKWLVSVAGFSYDWIITREWKRVLLTMVPVFMLGTLGGVVLWGKNLNQNQLASWYLQQGEAEIQGWEDALIGGAENTDAADEEISTDSSASGDDEDANEEDSKKISRYADMLFRRVLLLSPSDRAQYVIGANLAQSGALSQGQEMLEKLAPSDASGYAPAHAFLSMIQLEKLQAARTGAAPEQIQILRHHLQEASRLEKVPQNILLVGSELQMKGGNSNESIRLLQKAAERDPTLHLQVSKVAKKLKLESTAEKSRRKAQDYFREQIEKDPKNDTARVNLAESLAMMRGRDALTNAEAILREGEKIESTPKIARGLSEIYRLRFRRNLIQNQGAADVKLLDVAMRLDPTNPLVVEEIASLARIQGPRVSKDMIKKLSEFLAEGKATAATHAWLAETYLLKGQAQELEGVSPKENYAKALPHLEQIILRLPNSPNYLNNLAYVVSMLFPDRLEESVKYAERSVASAKASGSPNPDFYDTLATIYNKLDRRPEAIASIETAVEMAPTRQDFHKRAAEIYDLDDNTMMAELHRNVITKLKEQELARAEQIAAEKAAAADIAAAEAELERQLEAGSPPDGTAPLPKVEEEKPTDESQKAKPEPTAK